MRSIGKAVCCFPVPIPKLPLFSHPGLDVRTLVERARELCAKGEFEGREKAGRELAERIGHGLQHQQRKRTKLMATMGRQKDANDSLI